MADRLFRIPGPNRKPAAGPLTPEQQVCRARLEGHVRALAEVIGERHLDRAGSLAATVEYLEARLSDLGLQVHRECFGPPGRASENIAVEIPGGGADDAVVIVGAHYDTVVGSPGADDNASGVAALLELCRAAAGMKPSRTLRFVFFANEERPFSQTVGMGSEVCAQGCGERGENVAAMVALDGLACFSQEPDSQDYPFPLSLLYPSTADFIGVVGNPASRNLVRKVCGAFRRCGAVPSQGAILPALFRDAARSDHHSFWACGYRAVLVTDTLPFRYAHYHRAEDVPEKLDFDSFTGVIDGLVQVVVDLAGADQ
ncbi:MAG: M20/M25/M40 family metallo-hydrolase [Phycisphaerae bacterium]|nr:M20/M25/M40 family metallo-hydrolase [Phycisphaerae bacterium]